MAGILEVVQKQIALLVEADTILNEIDRLPQEQLGIKTIHSQLMSLEKEIERYKDLKTKVYQDMLDGVVSREEYKEINARFTEKLSAAKDAKAELEAKRDKLLSRTSNIRPWMSYFREYRNVDHLDRKMIASIIDSIDIYDTGRLEINYRYADEIKEMLAWVSELDDGAQECWEERRVVG